MPLTNKQHDAIMRGYDRRQYLNYRQLCARQDEIYQKIPRIRKIEESISSCSLRQAEKLFDVSAGNFHPVPKVASAVVGIVPHSGIREVYPEAPANDTDCLIFAERVNELISLAFGQRRKTLVNSISGKYSKEKTAEVLEACGIRADIRGEKLSATDFCKIADLLNK